MSASRLRSAAGFIVIAMMSSPAALLAQAASEADNAPKPPIMVPQTRVERRFVPPRPDDEAVSNGIEVDPPKSYDDRTLRQQLSILTGRLAGVGAISQSNLIGAVGGLQGATSSQFAGSLQVSGPMPPTVSTMANAAMAPTVTTGSAPNAAGVMTPNTVSSITNPGSLQTTTTGATPTSPIPAMPTATGPAMPTTYGVSSLDMLDEQMQLSFQLIQYQLLLEGSPADAYGLHGESRRRVTLGFPISIETPKRYRGAAAEVEVAVCEPSGTTDLTPTLVNILPQEKTYNTASLNSSSFGLGAGDVIGGLVSVGGSFLWGHQTYYMVRAQDTVAVRRSVFPVGQQGCGANAAGAPKPYVAFAWQFRPVLGRPTIDQGMRQTFAQVSLGPGDTAPGKSLLLDVVVRACWRRYDRKSGVVDETSNPNSCQTSRFSDVAVQYTPGASSVRQTDNGDGGMTIKAMGSFPLGTRVLVGDAALTDGSPGFVNADRWLKFTANDQAVALRGVRIVTPDGEEQDLVQPAKCPGDRADRLRGQARLYPYDDDRVRLDIRYAGSCPALPTEDYPLVLLLGGKAYGLPDAPFLSDDSDTLSVLVPKASVQGQSTATLRQLFSPNEKHSIASIPIPAWNPAAEKSVVVLETTKTRTTFGVIGTGLTGASIALPRGVSSHALSDTLLTFSLANATASATRNLVLVNSLGETTPLEMPKADAPAAKPPKDDKSKATLKAGLVIPLGATGAQTISGSNLDLVSRITYPGGRVNFTLDAKKNLVLVAPLPLGLVSAAGTKPLSILFEDGGKTTYSVTVK